jgi:hypothetical protein
VIGSFKSLMVAIVIGGSVLGVICWRVVDREPLRPTHGVLLCDNSGSMADAQASCAGLAERALDTPKLSKGSTLTVITLGDGRSGNEPRLVARYALPSSRRALEGKGASARRKNQLLADLQGQLERLPRTDRSPIFLAVKRGIEQLRGSGCGADSACHLFVRTDGEETAESSLRRALDGKGKPMDPPDAIANDGIAVTFCGLSETSQSAGTESNSRTVHNARHGDRVREVWSSLFTVPDSVSFEPYCPKARTAITEN